MKRRDRQTARLLSVSEVTLGTTLSADAAVGATTLYVDDASVFDESGWLMVGTQVIKYTAIDDDAGTVTLATALTDAADTDDAVSRYSNLYGDVETVLSAEVAVLGDRDQADELTVEVADTLDLPTGDRGGDGENCTIESDGDVWTLISASGRPSKSRGWHWFWEPPYTLTAADIAAGSATIPLTYRPDPPSTELWWRRVLQDYGTDYTLDAAAQTVTLPLGSFCQAGDTVPIHYRYRTGLAADDPGAVGFVKVGATSEAATSGVYSPLAWPAGTQAGDLFVLGIIGDSPTCADGRATQAGTTQTIWDTSCAVWTGAVGDPSTPLSSAVNPAASFGYSTMLYVIRPERPVAFDSRRVLATDATATIPGLSGVGSGAVGVAFFASGLGGTYSSGTWPSPWTGDTVNGTYFLVDIAIQQASTIAATPALTTYQSKAWVLGLGLA